MKNIHILPTDKPSRLFNCFGKLQIGDYVTTRENLQVTNQHIYITNNEEIKDGGYVFWEGKIYKYRDFMKMRTPVYTDYFSIILTTDQDLIKDSVQAIDDEFLEWFVKNPSCEEVEVKLYHGIKTSIAEISAVSGNDDYNWKGLGDFRDYKIIIPKEEPKHETVEEAAEINCESITHPYCDREKSMFIKGAKWQAERMYSEEEVIKIIYQLHLELQTDKDFTFMKVDEWFEQFKKK